MSNIKEVREAEPATDREVLQTIRDVAQKAYKTDPLWPISERLGALEEGLDEIIELCEKRLGEKS